MLADLVATLRACLQRADREGVTKLVPTRAAAAGKQDFCGFRQFLEGGVNIAIPQGTTILGDEHTFPAVMLSAADQVTIKGCGCSFVERYQTRFLEFGFVNQQPLGCEVGKLQS